VKSEKLCVMLVVCGTSVVGRTNRKMNGFA